MAPVLRDDPEPEKARAPRDARGARSSWRPLAPARPESPGGRQPETPPRVVMVAGALTGLVLVATPPWHGIAFARFGDSPVYETLAAKRDAGPLSAGLARRQRATPRSTSTRSRGPGSGHAEWLLRRSCPVAMSTTSSIRSSPSTWATSARRRRRRSAGWACHARRRRSGGVPAAGLALPVSLHDRAPRSVRPLALEQSADPLRLFRVTGQARPSSTWADVAHWASSTRRSGRTGVGDDRGRRRRPPAAASSRPGRAEPAVGSSPSAPTARFRLASTSRGSACAATGLRVDVADRPRPRILAERTVDVGAEWTTHRPSLRRGRVPAARVPGRVGRTGAGGRRRLGARRRRRPARRRADATRWRHSRTGSGSGRTRGFRRLGRLRRPRESQRTALVTGPVRLFPAGRYRLASGSASGRLAWARSCGSR